MESVEERHETEDSSQVKNTDELSDDCEFESLEGKEFLNEKKNMHVTQSRHYKNFGSLNRAQGAPNVSQQNLHSREI